MVMQALLLLSPLSDKVYSQHSFPNCTIPEEEENICCSREHQELFREGFVLHCWGEGKPSSVAKFLIRLQSSRHSSTSWSKYPGQGPTPACADRAELGGPRQHRPQYALLQGMLRSGLGILAADVAHRTLAVQLLRNMRCIACHMLGRARLRIQTRVHPCMLQIQVTQQQDLIITLLTILQSSIFKDCSPPRGVCVRRRVTYLGNPGRQAGGQGDRKAPARSHSRPPNSACAARKAQEKRRMRTRNRRPGSRGAPARAGPFGQGKAKKTPVIRMT